MSEYDPLAFFDEDVSPAAVAAAAETAAAPAETAPAAPAPVVDGQVAAPAAVEKPEFDGAPAGFVPVAALQSERTKRQTLEEQIKASKAAPAAPVAPVAPVQVPPVGTLEHSAYLQDQIIQQQIDNKFNLSESRFTVAHGVEETQKLQAWVEGQDVFFFQRLLAEPDPYSAAKVLYDQEQSATAYKAIPQTELEAFRAWQVQQAANPAIPAVTTPAAVAPSVVAAAQKEALQKPVSSGTILTTPSAAGVKPGETPAAPGAAFANIFN